MVIFPRWAVIIRLVIGSPNPVPIGFVVTKGSKIRSRISSGIPGPLSDTAISSCFRLATVSETLARRDSIPPFSCIAYRALLIKFLKHLLQSPPISFYRWKMSPEAGQTLDIFNLSMRGRQRSTIRRSELLTSMTSCSGSYGLAKFFNASI